MCRARAALSTEAYLQGLSVGLATLGGSDGWMRFILPVENEAPNGKVASPERTWRVAMFCLDIIIFIIITWWLIPRIVSGLVHPSFLSGLTLQKSHVNHWGELTHLLSGMSHQVYTCILCSIGMYWIHSTFVFARVLTCLSVVSPTHLMLIPSLI